MMARFSAFIGALVLAASGAAPAPAQDSRPVLNHATVMTVLNTCVSWAEERELTLSIAVVDAGAQLAGFVTMDDAMYVTREVARRKAYTAVALNAPTTQAGWMAELPGVLEGGAYLPLQGGVPIRTADGVLLGAVGVSGAPSQVDEDCAVAGIEAAGLEHGVEPSEAE